MFCFGLSCLSGYNAMRQQCCSATSTIGGSLGCSANDQILNFAPILSDLVRVCMESPENHFQSYRLINDTLQAIFDRGKVLMGKRLVTDVKCAIFDKLAQNPSKKG